MLGSQTEVIGQTIYMHAWLSDGLTYVIGQTIKIYIWLSDIFYRPNHNVCLERKLTKTLKPGV